MVEVCDDVDALSFIDQQCVTDPAVSLLLIPCL